MSPLSDDLGFLDCGNGLKNSATSPQAKNTALQQPRICSDLTGGLGKLYLGLEKDQHIVPLVDILLVQSYTNQELLALVSCCSGSLSNPPCHPSHPQLRTAVQFQTTAQECTAFCNCGGCGESGGVRQM